MRERESRRMIMAKAEIETSLAEKEIQQWQRSRSGSRSSIATSARKSHGHSDSLTSRVRETPLSTASSPRVLDTRPMPMSFTLKSEPFRPSFQYIPKRDYDKALQEKSRDAVLQLNQQRRDLTDEFNRKLRETEENLRIAYGEKIAALEEQLEGCSEVAIRDMRKKMHAAVTAEENRRKDCEEELQALQHVVSQKNEEIVTLHKEMDKLLQKIHEDESQIRKLSDLLTSQNSEIDSLTGKTQSLEKDYAVLAKELTEAKLRSRREGDSGLKAKLRELEQENQLLKRDYEALSDLHRRTLLESHKDAEDASLFGFLRRDYDDDAAEMREVYEKRCELLSDEAIQWREKTLLMVSKHHEELQKLQREQDALKREVLMLQEDTFRQIDAIRQRLGPSPASTNT